MHSPKRVSSVFLKARFPEAWAGEMDLETRPRNSAAKEKFLGDPSLTQRGLETPGLNVICDVGWKS